ncbi:uncharacterized protein LOC114363698 [Ostrinia furnacalis]|uniref:uncharacterized protein LOC114363698 n=1 Tax=Ostrinia furnacalis TaxID=93504 RepID=UPI0010403C95|nr:uncharacterized protein LOC114363698 [Ostrinia furnacalis]
MSPRRFLAVPRDILAFCRQALASAVLSLVAVAGSLGELADAASTEARRTGAGFLGAFGGSACGGVESEPEESPAFPVSHSPTLRLTLPALLIGGDSGDLCWTSSVGFFAGVLKPNMSPEVPVAAATQPEAVKLKNFLSQ